MITEEQKDLLKQYREKAFISSVLAEESYNYYNFVKNLINVPLIICNSVMVCMNGSIEDQNTLKILNIILNSSTGLILSFISNFKIYEHISQYHQLQIKFNKLSHLIDGKITNEIDNINIDFIQNIIDDYDGICESQEFAFPNKIKNRIKNQYISKMSLPSTLSVDIVECKTDGLCCKA
jgi:hypothetical protein